MTHANRNNGSTDSAAKRTATGNSYLPPSWRQDILASVVVFLVALPLCMGIAIASGVPVAAGLITGIVGGLIVGLFSGAPLQVSGPAAGLTVIVYELVQNHGLEVLGISVLVGGVLQLVAGLLRYGRWFRAVSPAVIRGMLAGIGVLILSSQFHVMVDDAPKGNGLKNLLTIPEAIEKGLPMTELGSVEERTARRDLLRTVGALHERQVQLRETAAERIPPRLSADDELLAGDSSATDAAWERPEAVTSLASAQQEMSEKFAELVTEMRSDLVAQSVPDPTALSAAASDTQQAIERATEALRSGTPMEIRRTQAIVQRDFELVLAKLKNHGWAAKIGMLTIVVLLLWNALAPKRLKMIPAPLVAVVVATAVTVILKLPVLYVELPDNLWSEVHFPTLTVLQSAPLAAVIQAGIVLAVVASAETLLCATAVDQMQSHTRTKYDRELAAQGIGNIVCGFLGALPMTGVIVRSSANVDAGAKSRLSTILHGLWLLVFIALLAFVLRMIPTSTLAAMLVYTGYKLVNIRAIKDLRKYGWGEVAIYFVTLGMIVGTDLLTGVLTGIALSAVKLLHTFSHLDVRLNVDEAERKATLRMRGAATFIRLPVLATQLEEVPNDVELHVDFEHLNYIDHACLDLLMNWAKQHEGTGGSLVIDWESLHANFGATPAGDAESESEAEAAALAKR